MGAFRNIVLGFVACVLMSGSAKACNPPPRFDVNDIESAELVVVGSIVNYQFVKDLKGRERLIQRVEGHPDIQKYLLENPDLGRKDDHARFEIKIDEVILGPPQKTISAVWFNSTFGIHETYPEGPFLIALHSLPASFQSPAIKSDLDPVPWNVLQAPCSQPFIISTGGPTEAEIRRILEAPPKIIYYAVFGAGSFLLLWLLWIVFARAPRFTSQ